MYHRKTSKKTREYDELQTLKEENKNLKAIVKQLQKRIKLLARQDSRVQDLEEIAQEVSFNQNLPQVDKCPSCLKGNKKIVVLGSSREMQSCTICTWRKTFKK